MELREQIRHMPDPPDENDRSVNVWNVRELTLDVGRHAALKLQEWQQAVDLNAEIVRSKENRDAGAFEVARNRFNDNSPLLLAAVRIRG
jgi:hypothetical protein